jgi:hypothetical protein
MGLLETAAADLAAILADDVGGFSVPIVVTDPSNNQATINGLATDIGFTIDPETGIGVAERKASVALPIRALREADLGVPVGVSDESRKPWRVTLTLPTGVAMTFKVKTAMPDKLGCVVCFLEAYKT